MKLCQRITKITGCPAFKDTDSIRYRFCSRGSSCNWKQGEHVTSNTFTDAQH